MDLADQILVHLILNDSLGGGKRRYVAKRTHEAAQRALVKRGDCRIDRDEFLRPTAKGKRRAKSILFHGYPVH